MLLSWGILYLLAVQCLAVTEEGNTAQPDKKVPIGATDTSEESATNHKEPLPPEVHIGIDQTTDYEPNETQEPDVLVSEPDVKLDLVPVLGDESSNLTDTTSYQEPKPPEIAVQHPDYIPHETAKPVFVSEVRVKLELPIPNLEDISIKKPVFFGDFIPVGTEASKENENISIDILDSESKTNKSSPFGTEENSKIHNNRTKPEDLGLNEDLLMAQNTVNVLLSLCCIALSLTMIYFRITTKSTKSIVHGLYLQNGLADFFVGIGVLSQSPVLYLMISKGKDISGITVPVFISYFVTAVAVKMSVFLNCVLGVVRCIQIVKPHYLINKKVLTASTLFYMLVWMIIAGVDLWQFADKRGLKNQVFLLKTFLLKGQPGSGLILLTMNKAQFDVGYLTYHLGNIIQFIIPTVVPTLLCFVLMIVQLYHMPNKRTSKKTTATKKSKNEEDKISKASLTIFLLTCIYVITSGVSLVTWLVVHGRRGYLGSKKEYESLMKEKRTATSWSDLTVIYFSLSTCPLICSTLTPLTLLLRGTGTAFSSVRKIFTKSELSVTMNTTLSTN